MIAIEKYLADFNHSFSNNINFAPWEFISRLTQLLTEMISNLNDEYVIRDDVAIHRSAIIDPTAIIRGPAIIGEKALVGCFSLVRNGAWIGMNSTIGAHGEFKSSIIMNNSVCGHFNFIGESLIGSNVNLEAGAVLANHYNELKDINVWVKNGDKHIDTGCVKFGSVIGDGSRVGANAVVSPGILLPPDSVVKRLSLMENS